MSAGTAAFTNGRGWRGGAVVAAGVALCLLLSGWFQVDRSQPLVFAGDHLLTLGTAKSFVDGHGFRWNEHLGLPGVRDGLQHPTFYFVQKSVLWVTARVTGSAPATVAWLYAIGLGAVFVAAFWGLRRVGIDWRWAWLGAVCFVSAPYVATRSAHHDMLTLCFSVPLGVVLALWPALPRADEASGRWGAGWGEPLMLAVVIGASGMYYAFFTGLFAGIVALAVAWRARSPRPVLVVAVAGTVMVLTMLLTGPGGGTIDMLRGEVVLPQRDPHEQTLYGLVIADAVRVLGTWPGAPGAWRDLGPEMLHEGTWGEWPGLLLTAVILLAPFGVAGHALSRWRSADAREPQDGPQDAKRTLVWICGLCMTAGLTFAVRGGLGLWFNTLVTPAIRAQNRITPFLAFFALVAVLTWVAGRRRGGRVVAAMVALGLALGTWPAIGHLRLKQAGFLADRSEQDDRASIEALVASAHASGLSRILQLPVAHWPEAEPIGRFTPYRLELPYILDAAARPLRWSYGLANRQPAFGYLSTVVHQHLDEGLPGAAATLGFDAIYVEHAAFDPDRLAALLARLDAELDPGCRVFADARRTLFTLGRNGGAPCVRHAVPLDRLRYVTSTSGQGRPLLLTGWSYAERDFTWTDGTRARLRVPLSPRLARAQAVDVTLMFSVYRPTPSPARVVEFVSGDVVRRVEVGPSDPPILSVTLTASPDVGRPDGAVLVVVDTPHAERPSDHGSADGRRLGVALREVHVALAASPVVTERLDPASNATGGLR